MNIDDNVERHGAVYGLARVCSEHQLGVKGYCGSTVRDRKTPREAFLERIRAHLKAAAKGSTCCRKIMAALRKHKFSEALEGDDDERLVPLYFGDVLESRLRAAESEWTMALGWFENGYVCKVGGGSAVSKETRRKLSDAMKKTMRSPEARRAAGSSFRGKRRSFETKAKMAASQRKRFESSTAREQVSKQFRGKPLSAEHRAKLSAALRGRSMHSPETRAKIGAAARGRTPSAETREKLSESCRRSADGAQFRALNVSRRGKPLSQEHRLAISKGLRRCRVEQML